MNFSNQSGQQHNVPLNNQFNFPPPLLFPQRTGSTSQNMIGQEFPRHTLPFGPPPINQDFSQHVSTSQLPVSNNFQYTSPEGQNHSVKQSAPSSNDQNHPVFPPPMTGPQPYPLCPPLPPSFFTDHPPLPYSQVPQWFGPSQQNISTVSSYDLPFASTLPSVQPLAHWLDSTEKPHHMHQELKEKDSYGCVNNLQNHKTAIADEIWIKNWIKNISKLNDSEKSKKKIQQFKISKFKCELKKFATDLKELESFANCLSVLKKSLSEKEWEERCKDIEQKKVDSEKQIKEINLKIDFAERYVKLRKKKRIREKRKKKEMQDKLRESKIYREREHKRIDMWLEKMKEEVERTKREEQIKAEADIVLSEVTQKKSEAKHTLTLLSTLTKLRNARVQSLIARGGRVSENENQTFSQIIDKLKKYWIDQLKEYNVEEQGLRVMLNHAEVERSDVQLTIKKQIFHQWGNVIFGKQFDKVSEFEPHSLEELVSVRFTWDKYICMDNSVMATHMPIGWVTPSGPSNHDWALLLDS